MKKNYYILPGLMFLLLVITSCTDKIYETFTANAPVYMSYEALRSAVKMSPPRDINKPGKIYFKDQYVLINEMMKGVHVFDVSDPANPQNKGFIEIPGNVDIAIKDNILYADSYIDLVSIDVSNFDNVTETGRVQRVFPYTLPVYDTKYPIGKIEQEKGVVIAWEVKSIRQEIEQRYYPVYYYDYNKANYGLSDAYYSGGIGGSAGSASYGVGGSMARFALYKDLLYIVNQTSLMTFKLKSSSEATLLNTSYLGWNVETIYTADQHLFLGTQNGLLVQSLEVPERPLTVGSFTHMTSCDPVVIKGDLAFVTLKGGTTCRGGSLNQLDVIRMSDNYSKFNLVKSYPMYGPNGLGIDGDLLFVCDGQAGLKIYNAADPLTITEHPIASFPSINAYDVIPMNNYLFLIGEDGFLLYDYKNIQDIKQIGVIRVIKI
ncbi:MAG: LVIVD repeat-containing protein [Candidatus Saccharibacteria bacterium]